MKKNKQTYEFHYSTVVPLFLAWLSFRSVLVVAMVSARAMSDICSIRVNPGKLEWRRWLDRTWACSGPKYVGLYCDRSITYKRKTRQFVKFTIQDYM